MNSDSNTKAPRLRISLLSLHGLIRGRQPELGRDADTGGQIKYVLELAQELGRRDEVESVELITRQIIDPKLSADYAQVEEPLGPRCKIVRIPFGPKRYMKKEALWPYLEIFVDQCLVHFRRNGMPNLIHGHYADAGYAGALLARLLHLPFVFTGHSLGRVKRERLIAGGNQDEQSLENNFHFRTRNEAEEMALETAALVITSTTQEVREQYEMYEHYQPERMEVIPPGVDLDLFYPSSISPAGSGGFQPASGMATGSPQVGAELAERSGKRDVDGSSAVATAAVAEASTGETEGPESEAESDETTPHLLQDVRVFLRDPDKPVILAVARLDERKNFETLVRVYGESQELRRMANLILIMGRREDPRSLPPSQRRVLHKILTLIDRYNLYGQVAYPKTHQPDDIPELYRWAARQQGVFINPALTEPFGLTLLEAAATGLPIVATNDGGPQDIISNCRNGLLVDPLDNEAIEHALLRVLTEPDQWEQWSTNGQTGVREHYSWAKHADRYLRDVQELVSQAAVPVLADRRQPRGLPEFDRLIITDLDNTLEGDDQALQEFAELLREEGHHVGFGIATGRRLDDVMSWLEEKKLPRPDVLTTAVGTELYYGRDLVPDEPWQRQLGDSWQPEQVREVMGKTPGLTLQAPHEQGPYKISFEVDTKKAPPIQRIRRILREAGLRVKVVFSLGMFLDVLPIRGGSDLAIRHLAFRWGFQPEQLLIAGDSGNDEGMLKGRTLGVVVGNYSPELEKLRKVPRIYFAKGHHARGILEGIEYYNFLGPIRIPNDSVE